MSYSLRHSIIIQERRRHGKSIQVASFLARNNIAMCALVFALFAQLSRLRRDDERMQFVTTESWQLFVNRVFRFLDGQCDPFLAGNLLYLPRNGEAEDLAALFTVLTAFGKGRGKVEIDLHQAGSQVIQCVPERS